eukprot:1701818-Amphidinium_carterae.1
MLCARMQIIVSKRAMLHVEVEIEVAPPNSALRTLTPPTPLETRKPKKQNEQIKITDEQNQFATLKPCLYDL